LIEPKVEIDRHYFWSNKWLGRMQFEKRKYNLAKATKEDLAKAHAIELPPDTKNQRKLLRNAVLPEVGLNVFNYATGLHTAGAVSGKQLALRGKIKRLALKGDI
jgi:hypothetical protein